MHKIKEVLNAWVLIKQIKKIVGAYLESDLQEYFDKFAKENGFFNKSDALKEIIRQNRSLFFKKMM